MSGLYMLFGTLIALGVLVTIHEFGHFWVARRCGVKVLRFSVGFGAPLLRWHDRQGTEFVVAAIPLGGYVKMLDEREGDVPEALLAQAFNRKSVRQRIAIVAAGPLANFLLAILFFWVLALLGSQQARPVIGTLLPGGLAEQAGLQVGQEILAVDGEATPGWAAVSLQLIHRLGETGELVLRVREADSSLESDVSLPLRDWQKGVDEPDPLAALGLKPWRPQISPVLADLEPQGPAALAGLQAGDRIVAFNDQPVSDWMALVEWVRARPGQTVEVRYQRDGLEQAVSVTLAEQEAAGERVGFFGSRVQGFEWPPEMLHEVSYGPLEAVPEALRRTWAMTSMTLVSIKKMLVGELSVKNLSGPVTIAKVAGASAESGFAEFLNFLALLSISLGVLNLLPIPVLDGGHLMFYLVEWVRGRPLPERVQVWGMQVGISLVVGVMLLALFNDLSRL